MFSSERLFDRAMVEEYAAERGWDATPPATPPDAVTRGSVTVVRDRYPWGDVFYAEDTDGDLGATWIEHPDDATVILPSWIADVRGLMGRPACLGFHESDHICDGGTNPQGLEEPPCRWRSVCIHVQGLVKDPGAIDRYLADHDDAQLWSLVEKTPAAPRKRAPREGPAATPAENNAASCALAEEFCRRACEIGGWTIVPLRYRAKIGEYYHVKYDSHTGLLPRYLFFRKRPMSLTGELKRDPGTEQSLCEIRTHERDPYITVQVWTGAGTFVREMVPTLHVVDGSRVKGPTYAKGSLPTTTIRNVTSETLNEAATALVAIVEGKLLNSWGAGATDPDKVGFGIGRWASGTHFKDDARYREARDAFLEQYRALKAKQEG